MAKKKGLIEQLKSLIGLDKEPVLMGAMCYETHMPLFVTLKCEQCGMEKEYDQFLMTEDDEIIATVEQIKALGYDAKVLRTCAGCANKLGFTYKDGTPLLDSIIPLRYRYEFLLLSKFPLPVVELHHFPLLSHLPPHLGRDYSALMYSHH